jgi:hypothetical protein
MVAWLHLASRGAVIALQCDWADQKRERARRARPCCYPFWSSNCGILNFPLLSFFSLIKETKLISLLSYIRNLSPWYMLIVMHCGSVFRIKFLYTDRVLDIILFELICFQNSQYSVSSHSFSCLALSFSFRQRVHRWGPPHEGRHVRDDRRTRIMFEITL